MRFCLTFFVGVFVIQLAECMSDPNFLWVEGGNCHNGTVTDKSCCKGESFCSSFHTEKACLQDAGAFLYCEWRGNKCRPMSDTESDVCCIGGTVRNVCHSMLRGRCPDDWQVDEQCCQSDSARKYAWLKSEEGKICCNAPCKEAMESGCRSLSVKCAPSQRSLAMLDAHESLGFDFDSVPSFRDFKFGNVLSGTGFKSDRPWYVSPASKPGKDRDYDYSKDKHLDEITVDDLFMLMIEGLEKDSDVKLYGADVSSDPYLGKTKSGGLFVDHRFPDADEYLDRIYGHEGLRGPAYPAYGPPLVYGPQMFYGLPAVYGQHFAYQQQNRRW